MNNLKTFGKFFRRMIFGAAVVCPLLVSCDTAEMQEQIDILTDKVLKLEQKLNDEIKALNDMMTGRLTISSVETSANSGITTVTLSDGTELTLLPDLESFVTYQVIDGVKCWAYINNIGVKTPFQNKDGEYIPIDSDIPEVVVRDGETFIEVGGEEYPLSGNSIFSDYELVKDSITGEVQAVVFTFGGDMTFTVTVDGVGGFIFIKESYMSTEPISDFYVANGMTETVQFSTAGVEDYLLQLPAGWKAKEEIDVYLGKNYLNITAPSKDLVESGAAEAGGILKVMAILNGGKATMTQLELSTNPFKELAVVLGNETATMDATVTMYNGINKYVYGICPKADFDEAALLNTAKELLGTGDYVQENNLDGTPVVELMPEDFVFTPGTEYSLWAVPALWIDDEIGYGLLDGTLVSTDFGYSTVKFELGTPTSCRVNLDLNLEGVDSYYLGVAAVKDFDAELMLHYLSGGSSDKYALMTDTVYNGDLFDFTGYVAEASTDYVAWLVVAEEGKTYTADDLIVREFTTLAFTPGSELTVTPGTAAVGTLDIEVPLSSTGADLIYYIYLLKEDADRYVDETVKAEYILKNGQRIIGSEAVVKASSIFDKNSLDAVWPDTEYTLWAVAVDGEGKYGTVLTETYSTLEIDYNELTVKVSEALNGPKKMIFDLSVEGGEADEYLYWIGLTDNSMWKRPYYLGGKAETAQVYMYVHSEDSEFKKVDASSLTEGKLEYTGYEPGKQYVLVIMAKDADGQYSKATAYMFDPALMDYGVIVTKDDPKWTENAPKVEFIEDSFAPATSSMGFGSYSFNLTLPQNYTAYVLAAADAWLVDANTNFADLSTKDLILKIMLNTDVARDVTRNIDGVNTGFRCKHGNIWQGLVVFYANEGVHDATCTLDSCLGNSITHGFWDGENDVEIHNKFFINDGEIYTIANYQAAGNKNKVVDRVYIVLQDLDGNCYEPYITDVPFEYFANAKSK